MAVDQTNLAEVQKMIADGATGELVNVPTFHSSTVRIAPTPTNFNLIFARHQAVNFSKGNERVQAATLVDVVALDMSPQAAKDLALVLMGVVKEHEKEWGILETEYTRKSAEPKPAPKAAPAKAAPSRPSRKKH